MTIDKANIFNLDEILFEEYRKTPFYDCMPGAVASWFLQK